MRVPTGSLEAFQEYSQGLEEFYRGDYVAAIPFFDRATTIDSEFANAWRVLGLTLLNARADPQRARDASTRAFALIDRVSEKEKLAISGTSYMQVTRETTSA